MDKSLVLFDKSKTIDKLHKEKYKQRTDIQIYNEDTNELIFRGSNKVIISGAAFTARRHFDLGGVEITPTYNTALGLEIVNGKQFPGQERVFLFAVGTDGCGRENSQVYEVDYTKWITPEAIIPFRYQDDTNDIDVSLRNTYFGRRKVPGTNKIAYYFKAFESKPVLKQQYIDGTPIDSNIYASTKTDEVETYVEVRLKITKEDCRDFFIATTGINDARINTISLLTAYPITTEEGLVYYEDIRPLTKFNFPNESLIDTTKGIDIVYHIYY